MKSVRDEERYLSPHYRVQLSVGDLVSMHCTFTESYYWHDTLDGKQLRCLEIYDAGAAINKENVAVWLGRLNDHDSAFFMIKQSLFVVLNDGSNVPTSMTVLQRA